MDKKDNKIKIVKIEKKPIELTEEQIELKEKLQKIDKKIDDIQDVYNEIYKEDNNTMFVDELLSTITIQAAILASIDILADYFNVDKEALRNMFQ